MTAFAFDIPQGRTLGQFQFSAAFPGFFLLSSQPLAKGRDEVVVGQLIVALRSSVRANALLLVVFGLNAFGIGRRDQPDLAVQYPDEVFEISGSPGIS